MMAAFLPYGRQDVDQADIDAVVAVLKGDWLTTGPAVASFEKAVSDRLGAAHAISCANGTAGLHLAALALGLGPGDWVVVPSVTFLATANALRLVGADVIFADVDETNGLMGLKELEEALERAGDRPVKALFNVHYAGQCDDLKAIREYCEPRGIKIVDDACHAIGTSYTAGNTRHQVGACAHCDLTVFSFHPVKTVTMGEGGTVTTCDDALAEKVRRLRNHGMTRNAEEFTQTELATARDGTTNPWYYELHEVGLNYRATDIQCALGESQLRKLARYIERRAELVAHYDRLLAPLAPRVRPLSRHDNCDAAWHLYVALCDFSKARKDRSQTMRELFGLGIGTQVHYLPLHLQPYYNQRYGHVPLPGAEAFYQAALSLPLFPTLTDDDVVRVVESLTSVMMQ